ncbi:MAG: asparagine synthase (glutamine-hydrolyzing) [Gammaproteobacteria bacterium]|nr:MAG: asparagine synthase (glutamine-hydrolyzing) [Gammaproteobacteria bacterium]
MCGLAGLIRVADGGAAIDAEAVVRRMCDLQAYRGPDDSGVTDLGRVCLGSRRLSIIDLSPAGHMPMSDAGGRWWIAYNGEVYNFATIREELLGLGHSFRSHTDTEVILHAWMQWGRDCLQRFVGMFAFAIHDRTTDEVTLVRDRYGKKPLYYARDGGAVFFSSEIKGLMAVCSGLDLDERSLLEWFLYRNVDALAARTLVKGIEAVMAGHVVTISPRGIESRAWYSAPEQVLESEYQRFAAARPAEIVDEVDQLLNDAVRLRLIADVPVGTLLSGGLDSSLVTSIAGRYTQKLTAFHVSVAGYPKLDERRYAEQLARQHGFPFVPFELTGENFRQVLPYVTWLEDLPLTHPNSCAYYQISRVAREHGVPVVLSGEGADELFGGYQWNYRRRQRLARLQPLLERIPEAVYSLLGLLVYSHARMPIATHGFRNTLPATVTMIDRNLRQNWLERCKAAFAFVSGDSEREVLAAMLADLSDFLSPLLRRLDRTSMGASVEARIPFLDHRLAHLAINLPLRYKVAARVDKWILKQVALRYMPRSLVMRRKAGFPIPVSDYIAPLCTADFFAGGFCEARLGLGRIGIQQTIHSWRHSKDNLFGFVALEIWGRVYFLGQSVDEIGQLIADCERRKRASGSGAG